MEAILSIIFSLFIIEVLLSIDNALVNATLAESLPEKERKKAIQLGILLGAFFRIIALIFAAFVIQNDWIKILGALYLIYLACEHLGKEVDESGHTVRKHTSFKKVLVEIAIADIVFSIDNVVSAVSFSSNIVIVIIGVLIGVVSMLFVTPIISKVIDKYKGLVPAAYVIVGTIGLFLFVETIYHVHFGEVTKFIYIIGILLFTIIYEHSRITRKIFSPILKKLAFVLGLPIDILHAIKRIFVLVKNKIINTKSN